ncbi:CoA-transferase [Austwickia chelonae]|uniref:CoA-transferase n=1 Tax=Austwickia chelonae TaxID=100225 RepID=UPI000E27621C|nr:CoA-transferase [Austwickia chelonae]
MKMTPEKRDSTFIADGPDELVSALVRPGEHVHLAATMSRPNALQRSLARVFRGQRNLVVSTPAVHSSAHALALSGCCRKLITGFLGDTYPTPRPNSLYRNVHQGIPFEVELWSLLTYTQRLMAGALGQPFATTGSDLLGTSLGADKEEHLTTVEVGPEGHTVTLMTPLRPDIALYHGVCADPEGNIAICAPYGEGPWAAYAAKRGVIASVEYLVPRGELPDIADHILIPASRVIGLCEARYGAHPNSLRAKGLAGVETYLDDYDHLRHIVEACSTEAGARRWFDEWVLDGTHQEYVRKLQQTGAVTRIALPVRTTEPPPNDDTVEISSIPAEPTKQERLVILGARAIKRLVLERGYDTVLAGIGTSHIAAWVACQQLRADGHPVVFAAELGLVADEPSTGDVFLFSQRHVAKAQMLTGIPEILGGLVAANDRCLGVLSAAEVDPEGNLNTVLLPDGRWVTGSGGANDIASSSDCVVIAPASRRRYVRELAHTTSPGKRVQTLVSHVGTFHRREDGRFALASWLPEDQAETPADAMARLTSWDPEDLPTPWDEEPISETELACVRAIDPKGDYR